MYITRGVPIEIAGFAVTVDGDVANVCGVFSHVYLFGMEIIVI